MRMKNALQQALAERQQPVVTEYGLFCLLRSLYIAREFHGEPIYVRVERPSDKEFRYYRDALYAERYLRSDEDFPSHAYRVSDVPDGQAEDITAIIDPFCYISHLSAMQRYGLTNRAPEALILTTPTAWKDAALKRERQDYGLFPEAEEFYIPLKKPTFPEKVRKRPVVLHTTKRITNIRDVRGTPARIAAVGDVFVQMLDRPELCGGMGHVLDVWEEHARTYLDDLIKAIDAAPEKIVKVRAGYILQERLHLQDERIENWSRFAQRGGSRLLDPTRPYVSKYSEKWMISLNVESPEGSL